MNLDAAFKKAKDAQKILYFSTFDVWRLNQPENDWEGDPVPESIMSDIPCKFSQKDVPQPNQTDEAHVIETDYKILCDPDYVFKPGDRFTIHNEGRTFDMFYGGLPAVYRTHQEIRVTKQDLFA